jgi:hypothetical protein
MLYTEPLYRLGCPDMRFGYADDIALVRTGKSLEETSRQLATDLEEVLQWGTDNAIAFDQTRASSNTSPASQATTVQVLVPAATQLSQAKVPYVISGGFWRMWCRGCSC